MEFIADPLPFPPPAYWPPRKGRGYLPSGAEHWEQLDYARADGYRTVTMDVYVPQGVERAPCVVWIHGGAWLSGDRRFPPSAWPEGVLFQKIIEAGLAVATIDYRHSREAPFPAQLHDAKAAVRYVRGYADRLGIDPDRIAVWGESAGGHLAALTALVTDPELEGAHGVVGPDSSVAAVVSWYGVADVRTMPAFGENPWTPDAPEMELPDDFDPEAAFFAEEPTDILLRDSPIPEADRRRLLSPVAHVRTDAPPFLLVHGESDGLVPASQSREFATALRGAGARVEDEYIPNADHVWLGVDPLPIIDRTIDWLVQQLR